MSWLKQVWEWIVGVGRTLLTAICEAVVDRAKEVAEDKALVDLCLNAVKAAAKEGLTGEKAWVKAREELVAALKRAGRELGDCAIDTALQLTYAAWKAEGKPEA
mgnify:CR=1 FL=1